MDEFEKFWNEYAESRFGANWRQDAAALSFQIVASTAFRVGHDIGYSVGYDQGYDRGYDQGHD